MSAINTNIEGNSRMKIKLVYFFKDLASLTGNTEKLIVVTKKENHGKSTKEGAYPNSSGLEN